MMIILPFPNVNSIEIIELNFLLGIIVFTSEMWYNNKRTLPFLLVRLGNVQGKEYCIKTLLNSIKTGKLPELCI